MDGYVGPLVTDVLLTNLRCQDQGSNTNVSTQYFLSHELCFKQKKSKVGRVRFGHTFSFASSPQQGPELSASHPASASCVD